MRPRQRWPDPRPLGYPFAFSNPPTTTPSPSLSSSSKPTPSIPPTSTSNKSTSDPGHSSSTSLPTHHHHHGGVADVSRVSTTPSSTPASAGHSGKDRMGSTDTDGSGSSGSGRWKSGEDSSSGLSVVRLHHASQTDRLLRGMVSRWLLERLPLEGLRPNSTLIGGTLASGSFHMIPSSPARLKEREDHHATPGGGGGGGGTSEGGEIDGNRLEDILKDGTVLCDLMNNLVPGSIPRYTKRSSPAINMHFKMMENHYLFLQQCKKILPNQEHFEPIDVCKGNLHDILVTLVNLKKAISKVKAPGQAGDLATAAIKTQWEKKEGSTQWENRTPPAGRRRAQTEPVNVDPEIHAVPEAPPMPPPAVVSALPRPEQSDQMATQHDVITGESSPVPTPETTPRRSLKENLGRIIKESASPLTSLRRVSFSFSPARGSKGSYSDEDFADDDDWETDPDYQNPTVPPVRLEVVGERAHSFSLSILTAANSRAEVSQAAGDKQPNYVTAFGVRRGGCTKTNCPCDVYRPPHADGDQQPADGNEGGPCLNCGHYPTKHSDMGSEFLADHFGNSYKNWLIQYQDIQFEFKIGDGAFGTVWRAKLWGKHVAVKVLKQDVVDANAMDSFKREVEILCSLRHPNIVLFMGAVIEPSKMCIITEILSRGSLLEAMSTSDISWPQCLAMATDASLGVNYLHQLGIVHRDLKSSNLLVDENWNVKVGDFGLSQHKSKQQHGFETPGTAGYIAPEVIKGEPCTFKSDVYAMGVVLWELLTGQFPFTGYTDSLSIAAAIVNAQRPEIPSDCPPDFRRLIEDCWHMDPVQRPTFEEIVFRLRKISTKCRKQVYVRQPLSAKPRAGPVWGRHSC